MTADLKALHYLTAPNMIRADAQSKAPGLQNSGPMLLFDPNDHRCCQHNVSHGWPYFAEHLWVAAPNDGLAAALYAPSTVTAKVGDGTPVTITESTQYPFRNKVSLEIKTTKKNEFPLMLRIPGWCPMATIKVNKQNFAAAQSGGYAIVVRVWRNGDKVEVTFDMPIRVRTWPKNDHSVSVDRGPLTYSLQIGEKVVRHGGTEAWPAFEIHPSTDWNYGLALGQDPTAGMQVLENPWPADDQPFDVDSAPVEIKAKARKIPEWKEDYLGLVGLLQPSPAISHEPLETVTLIPMGAARLRIAAFPTVTDGPGGHQWVAPKAPRPATASWTHPADTLAALSDGILPRSSHDQRIPRFTWWDRKGTSEWVQYEFAAPAKLSHAEVYWFDDEPEGHCRPPQSWKLQYLDGGQWKDVQATGAYGLEKNKFNVVDFAPVTTKGLRVVAQLRPEFSAGILEWIVK
jgi:hypothetical protein